MLWIQLGCHVSPSSLYYKLSSLNLYGVTIANLVLHNKHTQNISNIKQNVRIIVVSVSRGLAYLIFFFQFWLILTRLVHSSVTSWWSVAGELCGDLTQLCVILHTPRGYLGLFHERHVSLPEIKSHGLLRQRLKVCTCPLLLHSLPIQPARAQCKTICDIGKNGQLCPFLTIKSRL